MCLGRIYFRFNTFNTFWIAWPKFVRCGSRRLQKLMPKQTERDFGPTAACRMPAPLMWHINCPPPQFPSPPHTSHPTPSSLNDCRSATRYLFDLWNFLAKEFFNKTNFIGIILQLLLLLCAREEINNATRLIKARIHRHAPSYERVCVCKVDISMIWHIWDTRPFQFLLPHLPYGSNRKVPECSYYYLHGLTAQVEAI